MLVKSMWKNVCFKILHVRAKPVAPKGQPKARSLPYMYILCILQFTTGSILRVLQACVLLRYKRDGSKRKMYKSIRQVRILQILYNKAVCKFYDFVKKYQISYYVSAQGLRK